MSEKQEIMNHYCRIILLVGSEERRKGLEQVPEHQREEVKRLVTDYINMRAQRKIASENARLAREAREETEKRRRKLHGG